MYSYRTGYGKIESKKKIQKKGSDALNGICSRGSRSSKFQVTVLKVCSTVGTQHACINLCLCPRRNRFTNTTEEKIQGREVGWGGKGIYHKCRETKV